MKKVTLFVLVLLLPMLVLAATVIKFDSDPLGSVPRGWSTAVTHSGTEPKWEIVEDGTGSSKHHVLAQTATTKDADRYAVCVYDSSNLKDGEVSVSYKLLGGRLDSTAGVVWRYQDPNNYYIARTQGLGDNLTFFKVVKGTRTSMAPMGEASFSRGIKLYVATRVWSKLRVTFKGPLFTAYLNGEKIADVADASFPEAGKVGVWVKSDSHTYFDNFAFK